MGAPSAQVQSPQSSSGKGIGNQTTDQLVYPNATQDSPQPSIGKGSGMQGSQGQVTFPGQGGQPEMGMPNAYSNTISPSGGQNGIADNSPKPMGKSSAGSSGKGKGA
jgi:hypothetical protein